VQHLLQDPRVDPPDEQMYDDAVRNGNAEMVQLVSDAV
jgi:hypothetical protein